MLRFEQGPGSEEHPPQPYSPENQRVFFLTSREGPPPFWVLCGPWGGTNQPWILEFLTGTNSDLQRPSGGEKKKRKKRKNMLQSGSEPSPLTSPPLKKTLKAHHRTTGLRSHGMKTFKCPILKCPVDVHDGKRGIRFWSVDFKGKPFNQKSWQKGSPLGN